MLQDCVASFMAGCALVASVLGSSPAQAGQELYFPSPSSRDWVRVEPAAVGWNADALESVVEWSEAEGSTGLLVVQNGRIVAEHYWPLTPARKVKVGRFASLYHGETPEGWPVEDVSSIQKSVASVLIGIARRKGLIDIERSVSSYIGAGWSKAPPEKEAAITVRHLLSMASGLDERLGYVAPAGSRWLYNTTAYGQLDKVLESATGRQIGDITKEWLTDPIGMTDSRWERRSSPVVGSNNIGFVTTPRDLARFGLLMLNRGVWDGRDIIADPDWLKASFSPSQNQDPAYGYLWWLNRSAASAEANQEFGSGWHVPAAPADMIAARGNFTRRVFVVPSLSLVVVRFGPEAKTKQFDQQVWPRLMRAIPSTRPAPETPGADASRPDGSSRRRR